MRLTIWKVFLLFENETHIFVLFLVCLFYHILVNAFYFHKYSYIVELINVVEYNKS